MSNTFLSMLLEFMSRVSGEPVSSEWELKLRLMFGAGIFLILFGGAFIYFFRKHFWSDLGARRLFWLTLLILGIVCSAKFIIYVFAKGYVPDRMLFYALPSPKFGGFVWLLPIAVSLTALWRFRVNFSVWPLWKFLLTLWFAFSLFAVGIAGIREGKVSIADPFTRSELEYTGYLPHIENTESFFRGYVADISDPNRDFADHAKTHPPGYVALLYMLKQIFYADLFGLALLVTALGGLLIFPMYFFWREFISEENLRNALPVFIFIPSLVMFSATSMDIISPLLFWLALALSLLGWKKSALMSFAGGVLAGIALLMNFLFLPFGLVFLFFFIDVFRRAFVDHRSACIARAFYSVAGFVGFFLALYGLTGYSVVENFFAANSVHTGVVDAGASSLWVYLLFTFANLIAFFLYLGIPNLILFFRKGFFRARTREDAYVLFGFALVALFAFSGIFQGEVERIWLFLVPLFLPALCRAFRENKVHYGAVIWLLVLQIVTMQTLFYTYW